VHVRRSAYGVPGPARHFLWRHGGLPVLVHKVSQRARGLRLRGTRRRLALSPPPVWPASFVTESASRFAFSKLNTRPTDAAVYASRAASRRPAQNSRSGWNRYLLSCETLSFPTSCRFIPAHHKTAQTVTRWRSASAANTSAFVQTPQSKVPRPKTHPRRAIMRRSTSDWA
jgi:hypothetical protein